ncbi:cannabinoid receptor 1-like [Asterias rubens]|uniref:cannabinoid receptor 1-like n=1 Tax=Asterias rubens TaxID=7604 RepID=UPI00145534CE|nr:cannabinoid receptor 1-like [Asterias rubens]
MDLLPAFGANSPLRNCTNCTNTTSLLRDDVSYVFYYIGLSCNLPICIAYISALILILKHRCLHDASNFFLANLQVAGLLFNIAVLIFCLFSRSSSEDIAPLTITGLTGVFQLTIGGFCFSSVVVGADRFYKISRPMRYMQFVTNKLSVYIIIGLWSVLIILLLVWQVGAFATVGFQFPSDDELKTEVALNYRSLMIFIDVVAIPCLVIKTCLCVGLVRIARAHKRRIRDEQLALAVVCSRIRECEPSTSNSSPKTQQKDTAGPKLKPCQNANKETNYFVTYVTLFVLCWFSFIALNNIGAFGRTDVSVETFFTQISGQSLAPLTQVFFGTMFLTYSQSEHRKVLGEILRSFRAKFKCF